VRAFGRVSSEHRVRFPKGANTSLEELPGIEVPIQAVPLSWSILLCRPVTLRRHLSVVLPFSDSWCDYPQLAGMKT